LDRAQIRGGAWATVWIACGAVGVAGFSVSSLLPEYSALGAGTLEFSLLVMPLLFGFLVGVMLADYDLSEVAVAAVLMTVVTLGLVGIFFLTPVLAGLPSIVEGLALFTLRRVGIAAILIFPLTLTGSIVGHVFASTFLTSGNLRQEIKRLQQQTLQWHAELERIESREASAREGPKKPEGPKSP